MATGIYKRTEEYKKIMSERMKGIKRKSPVKFSEEHRRKIGQAVKGRIVCEEVRRKISDSNKGKIVTEETRKKLGQKSSLVVRAGEKNPNWKGGLSCEPYCPLWVDGEYKNSIKERDGNSCLNPCCLNKSKKIVIHHINYNKKDCKPNNLITLCNSCNTSANGNREWHQSWYQTILLRRYNVRN